MLNVGIFYPCFTEVLDVHDMLIEKMTNLGYDRIGFSDLSIYYELVYSYAGYPSGGTVAKTPVDGRRHPSPSAMSYVPSIPTKLLNSLFSLFNSDQNPLGSPEGQALIEELHAHTSMAAGDVISVNDTYYVVAGRGFHPMTRRSDE